MRQNSFLNITGKKKVSSLKMTDGYLHTFLWLELLRILLNKNLIQFVFFFSTARKCIKFSRLFFLLVFFLSFLCIVYGYFLFAFKIAQFFPLCSSEYYFSLIYLKHNIKSSSLSIETIPPISFNLKKQSKMKKVIWEFRVLGCFNVKHWRAFIISKYLIFLVYFPGWRSLFL